MTATAQAGFKVPNSVFKMDELSEAKAKAKGSTKPLIFVYSNPEST